MMDNRLEARYQPSGIRIGCSRRVLLNRIVVLEDFYEI